MRVPVYQPRVGYEKAYAQNVRLALPSRQDFADNDWSKLAQAGDMMQSLYSLPQAAKRTAQAYQSSAKAFEQSLGLAKQANSATLQSLQETDFSSPKRQEQLSFARTAAAQETPTGDKSVLEKLDEKFLGMVTASSAPPQQEDLLTQDYVILRKEMQHLQQQAHVRSQKENLRQGAGSFVQTAAMVRTPQALEAYINSNMAAAQKEAQQAGLTPQERQGLRALYSQAVRHNVQAALQAGESKQARAVYEHFSSKLPQADAALLERKINAQQADQKGQELWPAAWQSCVEKNGEINEEKLENFIQANSSEKDPPLYRQDLKQALQARLAAQQRKDLHRRAEGYRRFALASDTQDIAALMAEDGFAQEDFEQNQKALRLQQSAPQKASLPQVFNRLQNKILAGTLPEEELNTALAQGQLSAADYWRLKARGSLAKADGVDMRQRLLGQAVRQFCKNQRLSPQQTEEIEYFVFSSSDDVQQQLAAAGTVRQIFQLQENK